MSQSGTFQSIAGRFNILPKQAKQQVSDFIDFLIQKSGSKKKESLSDSTDSFRDLLGAWSEQDLDEFRQATSDFDKIDPAEWQ